MLVPHVCGDNSASSRPRSMIFLTTQPLWIIGIVLLVPTTILAMCGPRHARLSARQQ